MWLNGLRSQATSSQACQHIWLGVKIPHMAGVLDSYINWILWIVSFSVEGHLSLRALQLLPLLKNDCQQIVLTVALNTNQSIYSKYEDIVFHYVCKISHLYAKLVLIYIGAWYSNLYIFDVDEKCQKLCSIMINKILKKKNLIQASFCCFQFF